MLIKNYYYLSESDLPDSSCNSEENFLPLPPDGLWSFKAGDALVLGTWNEGSRVGQVSALGVCLERNADGAQIKWREVDLALKPSRSGETHWRSKDSFQFDASVAKRYGLANRFAECFRE